jgi:hypothetical protein
MNLKKYRSIWELLLKNLNNSFGKLTTNLPMPALLKYYSD